MPWYGNLGTTCPQCGKDHRLVYQGDDIPDSTTRYEYDCPNTNGRVATTGIRAWSDAPMIGVRESAYVETRPLDAE